MSDELPVKSPATLPRRGAFKIGRLVLKELRETLRDRRTIVTLILMPLLVYPALSLVFKSFLLSGTIPVPSDKPIEFQLVYAGNGTEGQVQEALFRFNQIIEVIEAEGVRNGKSEAGTRSNGPVDPNETDPEKNDLGEPEIEGNASFEFLPFKEHEWRFVDDSAEFTPAQFVEAGAVDAAVYFDLEGRQPWELGKLKIFTRDDPVSQLAAKYIESKINLVNEFDIEQRLRSRNLPTGPVIGLLQETLGQPTEDEGSGTFPLASIVPLILILMTITGAVYPAIDLTAGERERGTLETLMAAPIPRFGILFSKFLAVLTVATFTAVLNIVGMFATIWAFQLDKQFGGGLFGIDVMLKMLLLLILFAAFFSAILLVVTSFAKSFKEAQVYLIPVILLSLGPGLISLAPAMTLSGPYAVCPMINILLLARDVINGSVELVPAFVAVVSTIVYSLAAIGLAARIFGSDAMLFADNRSLLEVLQRPRKSTKTVPFDAAMLCLVLLLPMNFLAIGFLSRMPSDTVGQVQLRFLMMGFFLFLTFLVVPTLIARHQRTETGSGFGLNFPRAIFLVAAVMLGVSLWPIVMSLTELWQHVYGWVAGAEAQAEWKERLIETTKPQVEMVRRVPWWIIAISFSIIPALCEEWFFRGMLLRTLLKSVKPWRAILLTAVLFGAFHMISNSVIAIDRLIPTTLVGLVLGYLAYKSDSIWPGVILHALHNAFVIFLAYFQETLMQQSWFPGEEEPIPTSWVAIGFTLAIVAVLLVFVGKRPMVDAVEDESEILESETATAID
ncbi:MAG: ABC transporter permease subunit/CPBP intramembrane protease [Planctomycetota bacterium]